MIIKHEDNKIEVKKVEGFSSFVNVTGVGKRRIYEDNTKQAYVKCFGKWFKFPQQIEY